MNDITDIIAENEKLIYKIINKYRNYFELEDLYQVAVIGIIKAYKNFDDKYAVKFSSYAYPYILGEVIKYINEARSIKLNGTSRKLYFRIQKAKEVLSQRLMKEPSIYELSIFLETDESIISETILANSTIDSLDYVISEDGKELELYDRLGYYDDSIENYPLLSEIASLPDDEREIIQARYYEDKTQKEVAESLGMYQVEVSRKERKILRKIHDNIAA